MSENPQQRLPCYERSVVTFLDVLGFSALIDGGRSPGELMHVIESLRWWNDQVHTAVKPEILVFSDSIVRMRRITPTTNSHLHAELLDLGQIQIELIHEGVLVRGAVAVGEIFMTDDVVFGPGFIRAHKLESEIAIYPRIVVSAEALQAARTDPQLGHPWDSAEQHSRQVMELLAQGEDGVWFVNYLGAPDPADKETLVKHRDLIALQRTQHKPMSRVALKYDWLALYHNRTIQDLPAEERNDLQVPFP